MSVVMLDPDDEDCIEFVQYLDEPEYEISDSEKVEQVVIEGEEIEQVEYIEAQQVDLSNAEIVSEEGAGHTLVEHNGRQYIIPNELQNSGHTIFLQDGDESEDVVFVNDEQSEYVIPQDSENVEVIEEDEDTEEVEDDAVIGRSYAVLRDGRLHVEGASSGSQLPPQLQLLEDSLVMEENAEHEPQVQEDEEDSQDTDDTVGITGKNLITGQTISLHGFMEKLRRKSEQLCASAGGSPDPTGLSSGEDSCYPASVKRQRRSYYSQAGVRTPTPSPVAQLREDYMLMPSHHNKKVLVGKTAGGKNIVGKILQIWKKVNPKPRQVRRKPITSAQPKPEKRIEEVIIDKTGKIVHNEQKNMVVVKKKYVSKEFMDQNIAKTLSGLMELESVQKNLSQRNLVIKHILRKSQDGKILPNKEVTYYYGHMEWRETLDQFNEMKTVWCFVPDNTDASDGIDTKSSDDTQQIDLENSEWNMENTEKQNGKFTETVPVNLIVTEDEFGKKKTKVTIPQLGGRPTTRDNWKLGKGKLFILTVSSRCTVCGKMFRNACHLARHMLTHEQVWRNACLICEHCGRTFEDETALSKHYTLQHGEERAHQTQQHVCPECNKTFTSAGSYRRHVTVHDHTLRRLQCMVCYNRFTDESSLKKHMVLHTGIKAFQCPVCLKCFVHSGDLNYHRKIHEPVKRFECTTCGKHFNRHSNMLRHSEIHRVAGLRADKGPGAPPFACELCGCHYNFMSSLTRHIVTKHMKTSEEESQEAVATLENSTIN